MYNTCVSSSFSLRCKGSLSFAFNDYACCLNDRYPLSYSSCLSSQCCACCANLMYNRVPITRPSYLYGLRQSSLIQWSPYKRLILNGFDRLYGSRFTDCDYDRSFYCENCTFQEKKLCGRRGKSGKGRYRCMVFQEETGRQALCGGSGSVDEAEVMLSLLTEEVNDECFGIIERRGKSSRKINVEKRESGGNIHSIRTRKKTVESGVLDSRSQFEYESKIVRSGEEDMGRKDDSRRVEEREVLLQKNSQKARAKEEKRDNRLREDSSAKVRKEEKQNLVRDNHRERLTEEEREYLSRQEDHRQKVRKDGSSCSSYYSFSSGDYESDDKIQVKEESFEGELSGVIGRNSERSEGCVFDEVREEFGRHGDYSGECGFESRKENMQVEISGASTAVVSDWRKKSEKRLPDASIEESESCKESTKKQSMYRDGEESNYGKAFGSYSRFSDQNKGSNLSVSFNGRTREQHKQASETEATMKYKQFKETSETHSTNFESYSGAQRLYHSRDENSSEATTSFQEPREYHMNVGQINRDEGYKGRSHKLAEASEVQEMDIQGTSPAVGQSEIRTKNQEDYSARILRPVYDTEKQRLQAGQSGRLEDSRVNQQQFSDENSLATSVSQMESERTQKQEVNLNFIYNSHLESREHHQFGTTIENVKMMGARRRSRETTGILIPQSDIGTSLVDEDTRKSVVEIAPSSSQLVARDSSHTESTSGLAVREINDERIYSRSTALHEHASDRPPEDGAHGQPLKPISPEDALGSADRLEKSSALYVGEFVDKVKSEISSSEIHKVKETHKKKLVSEEEQCNQTGLISYGPGVSQTKERDSKRSSQGSGTKGPSDEMWDVTEPSTQESPVLETSVNESATHNAVIKRTGKSLWDVIGDIVRFRWASRSENHGSGPKSGGKSSPNQSTGSETWFSGHEPEESNDNAQKDMMSLMQGSISVDQLEEEKTSSSRREVFSSSSSKIEIKHTDAGALEIVSSPKAIILPSSEETPSEATSLTNMEATSSSRREVFSSSSSKIETKHTDAGVSEIVSSPKAIILPSSEATSLTNMEATFPENKGTESSPVLHSLQLRGSPVAPGEAGGSSSGAMVQSDQPLPKVSRPEGNTEELKQRKLQRKDQIVKDRFDEWEEAYRFETEQRQMDEMFMREALLEAKKAADSWEVPVGAVLVQAGKIIARGYNLVEQLRDSTAHAEMICIREASNVLRTWRLSETTLYVTLEPCPMCAGAILQARIDTVVWGAPNKLLGADGSWIRLFPNGVEESELESSDKPAAPIHPFHPKIVIRRGILATECADMMQQFFQLRRKKEKKPEPSTPPSCLPKSHHHPSKFFTKLHDAFHIMFCL